MGTRGVRVSVKSGRSKLDRWDDLRMKVLTNPTQNEIEMAAKALKEGHLVAFPTETVYGLGADAENKKAVSRIYSVKGRPTGHPLIVHISSINQIDKWAINIPEYASLLAEKFWPGPMTLILKRSDLAKDFITGGQQNVGVRVPAQPVALALLNELDKLGGNGISAPSANRFGAVSPTTVSAVKEEIEKFLNVEDLILDDGPCLVGLESTIIDCTRSNPVILRPGYLTRSMVESETGIIMSKKKHDGTVKASGLLKSHYSPKAEVVLDEITGPGDGFLAMADVPTPQGAIRLASPTTIDEYAKNLYSILRLADSKKLLKISVRMPEGDGLAEAIRDRLIKASAKRSKVYAL
jgi:L-threonylcarbamoyladenylate synthase